MRSWPSGCVTIIRIVSRQMGPMPKPSEQAKAAFTRLVPGDPAVTMRPMFGNLAAFVNGNMFAGLFGEDLFVRLPDDESERVVKQGGRSFEPMPGRAMRGYVTVHGSWQSKPDSARGWVARALALTRELPAKTQGGKKAAAKKPAAKKPRR
jgi:TfoX/Sxy family transcriptional regulator of competence genes